MGLGHQSLWKKPRRLAPPEDMATPTKQIRDWMVDRPWALKTDRHLNQVGPIAKFKRPPSHLRPCTFRSKHTCSRRTCDSKGIRCLCGWCSDQKLGQHGGPILWWAQWCWWFQKKNDDGDGSLPRTKTDASVLQTPPIDSQWRLEASPPEGVKKPSQHLPELSPAPSAAPETSETPSGYSPSSRKSSAPRSEKNFDKYYHAYPSFHWETVQVLEIHVASMGFIRNFIIFAYQFETSSFLPINLILVRCHRYCKPRKGGVSKASKGALELWHDKKGGGRYLSANT